MARPDNHAVRDAVHRHQSFSKSGLLERAFTFAFRGLVYAQIWEDPVVDMEALAITPDCHIVTIASGGCNVLSYLTADPRAITAVDLNTAHIALNTLKLAAARHLPDHAHFLRFFGNAASRDNIAAYTRYIAPHLDEATRRYWEGRDLTGRRRIGGFAHGLHKRGLLGHFIGAAHLIARMNGVNPRRLLAAQSIEEQRAIFDAEFSPVFEKGLVRWLTDQPASLFGLGIPPAQFEALAGDGKMASVLRQRLEKLACDFDIRDNYFAWQAFGRGYGKGPAAPLPPYLQRENHAAVVNRVDRVEIRHVNMTDYLATCPDASRDRYILLDAQDWMTDAQLTALWAEITRTARTGARVLFRTAGEDDILPGRVPADILSRWHYDAPLSKDLTTRDRSAIYGGVHLYCLGRLALNADHRAQMDDVYRLQRHIYDLTRKYYLLGRDRLIDELDLAAGGTVLEVGCGTGRNLIRAARRWPVATFHGIDISEAMLVTAHRNVARAGLSDRIRLAQGDAAALDPQAAFGLAAFDRVVMSYTLSMIPPWREALAQAATVLAPGGRVAIVDFGAQEGLPRWWRNLLWAWLCRFQVSPRVDLPEAVAQIANRPGWSGSTRSVLRDYSRMATLSRT